MTSDELLDNVEPERRGFLKRMLKGGAALYAVPVIASFALEGVASAGGDTHGSNQTNGSNQHHGSNQTHGSNQHHGGGRGKGGGGKYPRRRSGGGRSGRR